MDVLIKNMTLPTEDEQVNITILSDGSVIEHFRNESGKWSSYRSGGVTAIELPEHGRLVDIDRMIADGRKGRKDVFPVDIESMDDLADFLETYADLDKTDHTVVVGASNDK